MSDIEYTEDTISIYLEDDTEIVCDILAIFEVNDRHYIALLPQTQIEGYEKGDYFFYRYSSNGAEAELDQIESEEEFEAVEDKFEELLDEEEFNSL